MAEQTYIKILDSVNYSRIHMYLNAKNMLQFLKFQATVHVYQFKCIAPVCKAH